MGGRLRGHAYFLHGDGTGDRHKRFHRVGISTCDRNNIIEPGNRHSPRLLVSRSDTSPPRSDRSGDRAHGPQSEAGRTRLRGRNPRVDEPGVQEARPRQTVVRRTDHLDRCCEPGSFSPVGIQTQRHLSVRGGRQYIQTDRSSGRTVPTSLVDSLGSIKPSPFVPLTITLRADHGT